MTAILRLLARASQIVSQDYACAEAMVPGPAVFGHFGGTKVTMDGADPADVIAVHVPMWRGVTAATRYLFPTTVALPAMANRHPDALTSDEIEDCADRLLERGARHVVLSGGDLAQLRLAEHLRARDPRIRADVLWHGTYVQLRQDEQWAMFTSCVAAARDGTVAKVGVVKKGMDALFRSLGCPAEFVMNYVPHVPAAAAPIDAAGWQVGLWPSNTAYTKLPHAMLVALSYLGDVTLHAANLDPRCQALVDLLAIPTGLLVDGLLPSDQLLAAIAHTHLTVSVTFAEACPMLPLESFSVGVPCLLGPHSHLFEDNAYLQEATVVPSPDRADVIASYAQRALHEREQLVEAYRAFAADYNERARRSVARFLA